MALYDGETARVKVTATDFNDKPVTDTDVVSATLLLLDTAGNYVPLSSGATPAGTVALTYDSNLAYWYYDWQNALPGTFTSIATFTGTDFEVFEYGTVRIKPLKVTPTGQPTPITGQEDNDGG